jgi:hypothetical protein
LFDRNNRRDLPCGGASGFHFGKCFCPRLIAASPVYKNGGPLQEKAIFHQYENIFNNSRDKNDVDESLGRQGHLPVVALLVTLSDQCEPQKS